MLSPLQLPKPAGRRVLSQYSIHLFLQKNHPSEGGVRAERPENTTVWCFQ